MRGRFYRARNSEENSQVNWLSYQVVRVIRYLVEKRKLLQGIIRKAEKDMLQKNPLVELSSMDDNEPGERRSPERRDDVPNISYALFESFFESKFNKLEKKMDTMSLTTQQAEPEFKYKGNKLQYQHNTLIYKKLQLACSEADNGGSAKKSVKSF